MSLELVSINQMVTYLVTFQNSWEAASGQVIDISGSGGRIWTCDLRVMRAKLYCCV